MQQVKKSHFALTVKSIAASKPWYDDVLGYLGFRDAVVFEDQVYYEADWFPCYIAIYEGEPQFAQDAFDHHRVGFHHLGIAVASTDVVDGLYELLKKKGTVIEAPPHHVPDYGDELYYALFFRDPDHLRLEVFFEKNT